MAREHRSGWLRALSALALAAACALTPRPASALDCGVGWAQGPGGYYRAEDRTGPYYVGSTGTACFSIPLSGSAAGVNGAAPVDTVARGPATYRGGTIAAANTSQAFLSANDARRGFTIQNQSTTDLYIKIGGVPATIGNASLRISPGQLYETPDHHVPTTAVAIIGATAGQAFYATEF